MSDRYLQINDDVGLDAEGNPEPAVAIGVAVTVPTMKDGEVVDVAQRVSVPPIAGTRIFKIDDPVIFSACLAHGGLHEVDPPNKRTLEKARKEVKPGKAKAKPRKRRAKAKPKAKPAPAPAPDPAPTNGPPAAGEEQ